MSFAPKVYVLIPVFNRLSYTRSIINALRQQEGVDVQIVIVDDGSTDGTGEFLAVQEDVMVLKGNGDLWWGGAIHLALKTIHPLLRSSDFFAFMNNDTTVDGNFLSTLVATSLANGRVAVGSVVCAGTPPHELLSIGPISDLRSMLIWDLLRDIPESECHKLRETYEVHFLSGRGTLYPGETLDRIGYMRPQLLPHYYADYEFAHRLWRNGFRLFVSTRAITYTAEELGNQPKLTTSLWMRKFGKGSQENLLHFIIMSCLVGLPRERGIAIFRILFFDMFRQAISWSRQKLHPAKFIFGILLSVPFSTIARARLARGIERRGARRKDALLVYTAALMKELRGVKVLLLCGSTNRFESFFRNLSIATESDARLSGVEGKVWSFVFCTIDSVEAADFSEPEHLAMLVCPGGIIFCASEAQAPFLSGVIRWKEQLVMMPGMELLVDTFGEGSLAGSMASIIPLEMWSSGPPKGAVTENIRFFAIRKLRQS